ncbi:hypothetical protein ACFE04_026497 [Oxalis oulophora]
MNSLLLLPLQLLLLLLLLLTYPISLTTATVIFKPLAISFPDLPAKFAADVDSSGLCGAIHVADPLNGCSPFRNRFDLNETEQVKFLLLIRGGCSFQEKIKNAQDFGFQAVIVYDDKDDANLIYMMVNMDDINIPAVFISKRAGELLEKKSRGKEGECCIFPPEDRKARGILAISCLALLVIIGVLVMVFFIPRQWMYWRHGRNNNNHRGPYDREHNKCVDSKMVETLQQFKFSSSAVDLGKSSRSGEIMCVICLEDYNDLEVIKVLPCEHNFHSTCVDSWLTKWAAFCPVCKLDVRTKLPKPEANRGICPLELPWR